MNTVQAIILGITQGLTEFIPVSSSGHLVLMHRLLGVTSGGLVFDVALHLGTLIALMSFFYRDAYELLRGLFGKNEKRRLALLLAWATVPAVLVGIVLESAAESAFRSINLVSFNLIIIAVIMILAERYAARDKSELPIEKVGVKQATIIGLAQSAAIVPGISRSAATITAGIFMGLDRVAATRFSFLLSIPITVGAILKVLVSNDSLSQIANQPMLFAVGVVSACLSGALAIKFLLSYLAKHSLNAFAYYRIGLGASLLLMNFI